MKSVVVVVLALYKLQHILDEIHLDGTIAEEDTTHKKLGAKMYAVDSARGITELPEEVSPGQNCQVLRGRLRERDGVLVRT